RQQEDEVDNRRQRPAHDVERRPSQRTDEALDGRHQIKILYLDDVGDVFDAGHLAQPFQRHKRQPVDQHRVAVEGQRAAQRLFDSLLDTQQQFGYPAAQFLQLADEDGHDHQNYDQERGGDQDIGQYYRQVAVRLPGEAPVD